MAKRFRYVFASTLAVAALAWGVFGGTAAASSPLVVPTDYPTIQAAVDAADTGDTVRVRAAPIPNRS